MGKGICCHGHSSLNKGYLSILMCSCLTHMLSNASRMRL
nr:MAG TPA: hypothetical protein [Caudoviricetes sp.]